MKTRSIGFTLKLRYWSSVIFYINIVCYSMLLIFLNGKSDIGFVYGSFILLTYMVGVFCLLVKGEAILKYSDPYNFANYKKYIYVFVMEAIEMITAGILAQSNLIYSKEILLGGYLIFLTVVFGSIYYLHSKILYEYKRAVQHLEINEILLQYKEKKDFETVTDVEKYRKDFYYFMGYVVGLIFLYKYTLHSWLITAIFAIFHFYILKRLFWDGINKVIKKSFLYFGMIQFSSAVGIILLKLIFDEVIVLSIFEGRAEQEYLMVLILFFLPIGYYGKKITELYSWKVYTWIK